MKLRWADNVLVGPLPLNSDGPPKMDVRPFWVKLRRAENYFVRPFPLNSGRLQLFCRTFAVTLWYAERVFLRHYSVNVDGARAVFVIPFRLNAGGLKAIL